MSDETTPQDDTAMPPASTGSVEPVAWLVEGCEYDTGCEFQYVAMLKEQADAAAAAGARLTPLYRHPQDWAFLNDEIARLRDAIRRLAEQDATLSVQGGSVIVEMDATLTDAEREAIEWFAEVRKPLSSFDDGEYVFTLRKLFKRLGGEQ